ncbi:hypothetical protein GCM10022267_03330 [Lentzea roselyniae]|uniref:DUF3592 domain-containing protein n=1 Tax=Lentzea roselyniae TaxID=531940 RepID=A0ABP6ZZ79_9PSEU
MRDRFLPDPNAAEFRDEAVRDTRAGLAILVGIAVLVIAGWGMPFAIRVIAEDGVHGTYVVQDTSFDCQPSRGTCYSRTGTFTSDDGKVVRTGVHVRNRLPQPVRHGDRIPAFDLGKPDRVYTKVGSNGPPVALPFLGLVVGLLILGGGSRYFWLKRKRR